MHASIRAPARGLGSCSCNAHLTLGSASYACRALLHRQWRNARSAAACRARRHILSFRCTGTFTITSSGHTAPWVRLRAHGQSFLLHQIRKMVGMAVAVYRGCAPIDAIHLALDPCCDFSTPMAPELGLFLCESKFDTYNDKFGNDRERLDIHEWDAEAARFRDVRTLLHAAPRAATAMAPLLTGVYTCPVHARVHLQAWSRQRTEL